MTFDYFLLKFFLTIIIYYSRKTVILNLKRKKISLSILVIKTSENVFFSYKSVLNMDHM